MDLSCYPDNPYILLTPGPLSTSKAVKAAMLRDWCTWDQDYNSIVQNLRTRLAAMASPRPGYTAVLMQGSGTFSVESCVAASHNIQVWGIKNGFGGLVENQMVELTAANVSGILPRGG